MLVVRTRTRPVCNSYPMLLALLRQYIRPYRRLVAALMVLQSISTLASLYLPTVNAAIIDDGVSQGNTAHHRPAWCGDAGGHRVAGAVRGGRHLSRLTDRDRFRPRPPGSDVRPRHYLLRTGDSSIRCGHVVDPQHQRRPADRVPGADDGQRAGDRADHVRRRRHHGHPPGGLPDLAAAGQRSRHGGSQLLDRFAHAPVVPQHATPDRRHQQGDARPAFRRSGGQGVHPRRI